MPKHTANKISGAGAVVILLVVVVFGLMYPIAAAVWSAVLSADADAFSGWLTAARGWMLVRSVGIAGVLGLAALVYGLPLGAMLCVGSSRGSAVLLAPIWLPSILVYAAFNLIRSPDTMIGRMLIETASAGHRWVTIWAGYLLAGAGLALWGSPIAAVLIAAGRSDQSGVFAQQLGVEPVGRWRKLQLWIGARRGELIRVWVILTVIFLGSAVPMHLAQFETWSIVLWRELSQRGPDGWAMVWIGSTPMLLAACVGSWMVVRTIGDIGSSPTLKEGTTVAPIRVARWVRIGAWTVWVLAVVAPMLAMLWSLDDPRSVLQFWRVQGGGFGVSAVVAAQAGIVATAAAVCVAYTLGHPSRVIRWIGKSSVFLLGVLGLVPGVLIGAAVARCAVDGYWAVVLAACMRTACVGAIVGAVVGAGEPGSRRALRWVEGSVGFGAWARAALAGVWAPVAGGGLAAGMLALYEIEAAVMVRPPGMENLPQQLLSDLHYQRLERLSAAGVNLLAIGLIAGIGAMVLMAGFHRTKSNRSGFGE